jgi:glycolate oxidase iron-sulfur subunit
MQTNFTPAQLADPHIADANGILRSCVHCGFCTATCPTYVLLGDELDSPRGRIYLIKNMLESGAAATAETVKHVDRCLSCLSCMTTCPSGVNYMHLIDTARVHIEKTYDRPFADKFMRRFLANVMPRPGLFRLSLIASRPLRSFAPFFASIGLKRLSAMIGLVPKSLPRPQTLGRSGTYPAQGVKKGRVGLQMGCVQSVMDPGINAATIRLLTRLGYEVVVSSGESCCGSLEHHAGLEDAALMRARRSIDQWMNEDIDAVVVTASGCGTVIKDYGHMLRLDPAYAEKAKAISIKAKDVTEFLGALDLPTAKANMRIAYHSACSMQHGQNIKTLPQALLRRAGFEVQDVPEGHLCCGSAGTYNILQPEISGQLRDRKIANINTTQPEAVATGNLGCITQLQSGLGVPILHTIELLDWAYGGPKPAVLEHVP